MTHLWPANNLGISPWHRSCDCLNGSLRTLRTCRSIDHMINRARMGKRAPSWKPTLFCQRIPSVAPGASHGPTPLTTPTRTSRSA